MSATAEIWKRPLLRIARMRVHSQPAEIVAPTPKASHENTLAPLAQQIFFSARDVRRTRVLLAAAGTETDIAGFTEQLGKAVSNFTHGRVALIDASVPISGASVLQASDPLSKAGWDGCGSQIAERLWRIPGFLFDSTGERFPRAEELPFEYLIFAARVTDNMFSLFSSASQGVVLALTANRTRKESALQAQRIIRQCDGTLLGTVLLDRKFPIPESIYRWL
jgi:hypothetical protein